MNKLGENQYYYLHNNGNILKDIPNLTIDTAFNSFNNWYLDSKYPIDYNTQLINISQSLIDSVNQDTDLIMDQKNQLEKNSTKIDTLMSNINLLKDKDVDMSVLTSSRSDSLNTTKTGTDDKKFTTYLYVGINILLVLILIGLILYIVFSSYGSKKNNSNSNITTNL